MSLLALGINHKTAPINIREHLALAAHETKNTLEELMQKPAINEAMILSTCNRTEIYSISDNNQALENWFHNKIAPFEHDTHHLMYRHTDLQAVRHIMRVASGLDSMVLGEPQIFGQMKEAFSLACEVGAAGQRLKHLIPNVFSICKQIRHTTDIGKNPVTFAYATVQLAKQIFSKLSDCKVLLIGAGETIGLVGRHLQNQGARQFFVANRTLQKAELLAKDLQAHAIRIGDIPAYLADMDIVISATASQLPIIGKGLLETVLKKRKRKPMFMVDLAVPRDIEAEIAKLADVYLYNIDDLQQITLQNFSNREQAAKEAEALINIQAEHYLRELQIFNAGDMISRFRQQLESIGDHEIQKAKLKIQNGADATQTIEMLARNLLNKFMHHPTIKLREAAYHDRMDTILFIKEFFNLK